MIRNSTDQIETNESCPDCGSSHLVEHIKEQEFHYGPADKQVTLKASMPVLRCEECGYEYFDERGEAARHEAICLYHGVQTPNEVRRIRELSGLTRSELCELAGFGSASLQRWESGIGIPNASSDRLLYLLRFQDNVERLKHRETALHVGEIDVKAVADHETKTVPTIQIRIGTKRFFRLSDRSRIEEQSSSWNLRGSLCTS